MNKGYWCNRSYKTQTVLHCSNCKYERVLSGSFDTISWIPKYCERCGCRLYRSMVELSKHFKDEDEK